MSYTCSTCGMTSHNPNDEKYKYCGNCHKFAGDQEFGLFSVEHPYSNYARRQYWVFQIPQLRVILAQDFSKQAVLNRLYELSGDLAGAIKYLEEYEDVPEKEA